MQPGIPAKALRMLSIAAINWSNVFANILFVGLFILFIQTPSSLEVYLNNTTNLIPVKLKCAKGARRIACGSVNYNQARVLDL